MGEQGIFLEYRIHLALIGREAGHVPAVKHHFTCIRRLKAPNNPQRSRLATPRRAQQRQKFIFPDI